MLRQVARVFGPGELTRYVNAPVKTTEVQSLISPQILYYTQNPSNYKVVDNSKYYNFYVGTLV